MHRTAESNCPQFLFRQHWALSNVYLKNNETNLTHAKGVLSIVTPNIYPLV